MPSGGGERFAVEGREPVAVASESVRVVRRVGSVAGEAMPEVRERISVEIFDLQPSNSNPPKRQFYPAALRCRFSEPAGHSILSLCTYILCTTCQNRTSW